MSKRNAILIPVSLSVIVLASFAIGVGPVQAGPVSITVNCTMGQTISGALAKAPTSKPLVITVTGTCSESVTIFRDDVTIQGATPRSGITAPFPTATIVSLMAAHRILLQQLALTGGSNGLFANLGSSFFAGSLVFVRQADSGISVTSDSTGILQGSTIMNSTRDGVDVDRGGSLNIGETLIVNSGNDGISAGSGGSIFAGGTTIKNSTGVGVKAGQAGSISLFKGVMVLDSGFDAVQAGLSGSVSINGAAIEDNAGGVHAFSGGSISIFSGLITRNSYGVAAGTAGAAHIQGISESENVTITANKQGGILAFAGGAVNIQGFTTISSNNGDGLTLIGGSSSNIQCASGGLAGCAVIENNSGNGVTVHDTSVFGAGSGAAIINNTGWGIFCPTKNPGPGGIFGSIRATVTGNGAGQNNCPVFS